MDYIFDGTTTWLANNGFLIAGLAAVLTLFFTGLEGVDPVVMWVRLALKSGLFGGFSMITLRNNTKSYLIWSFILNEENDNFTPSSFKSKIINQGHNISPHTSLAEPPCLQESQIRNRQFGPFSKLLHCENTGSLRVTMARFCVGACYLFEF